MLCMAVVKSTVMLVTLTTSTLLQSWKLVTWFRVSRLHKHGVETKWLNSGRLLGLGMRWRSLWCSMVSSLIIINIMGTCSFYSVLIWSFWQILFNWHIFMELDFWCWLLLWTIKGRWWSRMLWRWKRKEAWKLGCMMLLILLILNLSLVLNSWLWRSAKA